MKKTSGILIVIILMFSFMVLASSGKPCTADDPPDLADAYQRALGYLAGAQNADGSWGALPERDTFLVIEALSSSEDSSSYEENLSLASTYISQLAAKNSDIVSRKAFSGAASQDEMYFLATSRNQDGGYALAPGLPSTSLDTSTCFMGLLTEMDIENLRGAVSFLCDKQENGAYSLYPGGAPDLLATTSAARALNITRLLAQAPNLSQLMNEKVDDTTRAVDSYLASIQHSDGGFGEQASTAYETALVLEATSWSTSSSINVMGATSFLLDRQQADGSISGDEATTAMFCAAAGAKPYLPTSALSFDSDSIPENNSLRGSIKIGNMGLLPTGPFELNVALDDPDNTLTTLTVENVPPCGHITLPFEISLNAPRGIHDMYVSIAGDFNKDTNLYDNYATGSFNVEAGCNFALLSCASSPAIPSSSEYLELQARVRNTGEKGAGPVGVSFYEGSSLIGATSVTWLGANEDATAALPDVIMAGGDHAITAVLDEAGDYSETSEADNRLDFTVRVAYDLTIPELASPEDGALLGTKTPTLSWYPSAGAENISYILEVSSDPGSGSWSRFDGIPQATDLVSAQMPNPLGEGTIWWRIRATDGLKETDPSRTRSFTVDTISPEVTFTATGAVVFSPNADGFEDQADLAINLSEDAIVRVEIIADNGSTARTLCDGMSVEAGRLDLTWDGTDESGNTLEGTFIARVIATDTVGNAASCDSPALVSDITPPELTDFSCTPDLFSPNGDGKLDVAMIHATPTEDCELSISLINQAGRNTGLVYGPVRVGSSGFDYTWNGRASGYMRADGIYTLEANLLDDAGFTYTTSTPVTLDTSPPTISCPNVTLETTEVKVSIVSGGASTVVAHFHDETLELIEENGVYGGSFARPAEAGSYPMYVVAEDAAANATISDTVEVLISSMNFNHSSVQTTYDDFRAGEEKNGTDVETSHGDITLELAQGPTAIAPPIRSNSGPGQSYGFQFANAIVGADGRIYMAGGMISRASDPREVWLNTMYIYNPSTDSYSQGACMNGPSRITCSVKGADGKIYCFGGVKETLNDHLTDIVEVYDPVADSWETKRPLPYKLGNEAAALGPDGCIYLFGGLTHWNETGIPNEWNTAVLRYDPAADTNADTNPYTTVAEMPNDEHRCCFYAVNLNDKIYLMGGETANEAICKTVWEYDAVANTFTSCPDVPPASYNEFMAYFFGRVPVACPQSGSIYFVGGDIYFKHVQRYDTVSRNWTSMPAALYGGIKSPIACIGDKLYIFGGNVESAYEIVSLPYAEVYNVGYQQEGYFISSKMPLRNGGVSIGDIMLSGVLPPGASVAVSMRCSSDGNNWSDWSEEISAPGGTPALPASDVVFVQYRLRLLAENISYTPVISEVSVSYNESPRDCQFRMNPWGYPINPTGTIGDNTPTFCWWMCQDADNDPLTAMLELDRVPSMDSPERRAYSGLPAPVPYDNAAHFTIPDDQPLADGVWYYRVRCSDGMSYGRAVEPATLTVETTLPKLVSSLGSPDPFSPDADGVDDTWNLAATCDKPADGTLELYDAQGNLIKTLDDSSQVFSTELSFSWDGRDTGDGLCPAGRYAWELTLRDSIGNTSSPYKGTVDIYYPNGSPWQLLLEGPVAEPSRLILTDTGGDLPSTTITFSVDAPATVSAGIYLNGNCVKTFFNHESLGTGEHVLVWNGMQDSLTYVASGEYEFRISAVNSFGSEAAGSATIQVERVGEVIEGCSLSNDRISPNGDGNLDSTTLSFTLSQAANVTVEVEKDGVAIEELAGPAFLLPGDYFYGWDGTNAEGSICADGEYQLVVDTNTRLGTEAWYQAPCVVDTRPPDLKACLLDRMPGYPDLLTLSACFDEQPSTCTLEAGAGIITMAADSEMRMSAEVGTDELVDPNNILINVSDDLGNTAERVVAAHLPASVSPYEKAITTKDDFERGTLQGADALTWPGFLATDATSGFNTDGHFTSEVIDLGGACRLGSLSWLATSQPGAEISCAIRTSGDGVTWSEWSEGTEENLDLASQTARYVQLRVDFPIAASFATALAELRLGYENNGTELASNLPDLRVSGISFEPASPEVGDDVQVRVTLSNQGGPAIAPVLRLHQGAGQVGSDVVPLILTPGASQETTFTYKATEEGNVPFEAVVDPDGLIVESNEDNNHLSVSLEVQPSGIQAAVSTDKASYLAEEDVSVSSTVKNNSGRDRSLGLYLRLEDSAGNLLDEFPYVELGTIASSQEVTSVFSWNTGLVFSGDYRAHAFVVEGGVEKAAAMAPFAIEPQGNLALSATCDRVSYTAGDTASLRARLISEASNFCFSGLTARAEVLSPGGSVIYSSEQPCLDLMPGDLADVPFAFEVGDSSAGIYTFRATVFNGDEDIASDEVGFEVKSTLATGAGTSGSLTATPRILEQGAPYSLDYALANQGNCDLSGLPVWLLVVDPATGEAVDSRSLSIDLSRGASAQGTEAFSSAVLTSVEGGKDYLTILIAQFGDGAKTLAFTSLKVVPSEALNHFEVSPVAGQVAGVPLGVEVRALSASGLPAQYSGTLSFTDATGTLSPIQGEMVDGTFTGSFTITKAIGADVITVSAGDVNAATNSFEVVAASADHLTTETVASPQTAGAPFDLIAAAWDIYNNPASGFNGACTISDTTGTVTPTSATFASGVLNTQITVTKAIASDTVTITAGGLTATSNSFAVTTAAANHLTVSTVASPQTAGAPFAISAAAWDAYNNPASGFNGSCTITDTTGTLTPHMASFTGGTLSVQTTVTQAIMADTITISSSGMNVSSNAFEVKSPAPAVNIDLSLSIENQTAVPSVLVWTDGDANEALAEEVLTASGYNYTIVRADHDCNWHGDGDDNRYGCGDGNGNDNGNGHGHFHHEGGVDNFAAEMRSGLYNTYLLLSPDHPLEDGLADELRELVNAGAGLLVSDPANVQHFKEHPSRQGVIDLFGIKQKGNLASGNYTANLIGSVLSPACTLAFTGKMDKLEIDDAQTLGTVTIRRGNKNETWPALTLKQYGRGKASLAAFDFAKVAQADRNKAKTILSRALSALCAPGYQPDAGSLLPLRINLTNHGAAVSVKVEIPLPTGVTFLWGEGATLNQGKVVFTLPLAAGETRVLHMLLIPQQTGTYTVTASLYYQQAGSWTLLKQGSATASVAKNAASLKTDTLAAISALSVASRDRNNKQAAYGKVSGINLAEQNPGEVGEDIEALMGAADDLQRISSADTTAARLLLDRLLIQLQMRWYTLAGGGNR